jgi:hypothetical protein
MREGGVELSASENRMLAANDLSEAAPQTADVRQRGLDTGPLAPPAPAVPPAPDHDRAQIALLMEAGQYGFTPGASNGSNGLLAGSAGAEWELGSWLFGAELFVARNAFTFTDLASSPSRTGEKAGELVDTSPKSTTSLSPISGPNAGTVFGLEGSALYSWHVWRFAFRAGAAFSPSYQDAVGFGAGIGPRLRLDFEVTPSLSLIGTGDGRVLFTPQSTEPFFQYGLGLRLSL